MLNSLSIVLVRIVFVFGVGIVAGRAWAEDSVVDIYGQFGETRFAATEAMRRMQAILDLVYGEAGLTPRYVSLPFNRAYQTTLASPGGCLAVVARTERTETDFSWRFPVGETRIIVVAREREAAPVTLESLRAGHFGPDDLVTLNGAGQDFLDAAGIPNNSRPAADSVVRMVAAGRARYGVLLDVTYRLLESPEKRSLQSVGVLKTEHLWHACNRDDAAHGPGVSGAWTTLRKDGRLAALYATFGSVPPDLP